jgi:hypothetical protein
MIPARANKALSFTKIAKRKSLSKIFRRPVVRIYFEPKRGEHLVLLFVRLLPKVGNDIVLERIKAATRRHRRIKLTDRTRRDITRIRVELPTDALLLFVDLRKFLFCEKYFAAHN